MVFKERNTGVLESWNRNKNVRGNDSDSEKKRRRPSNRASAQEDGFQLHTLDAGQGFRVLIEADGRYSPCQNCNP